MEHFHCVMAGATCTTDVVTVNVMVCVLNCTPVLSACGGQGADGRRVLLYLSPPTCTCLNTSVLVHWTLSTCSANQLNAFSFTILTQLFHQGKNCMYFVELNTI